MAKIKNIEIINSHTIKLLSDASAGDEIDLLEISKIDTSIILEKINSETDKEYNKKLNDLKVQMESENKLKIIEALKTLEQEKFKLSTQLESKEKEVKLLLESKYNVEKGKLENQIAILEKEKESFESKKSFAVIEVKNELERQITFLKHQLELLSKEKTEEVMKVKQEYIIQFNEQEKKIANLELTKSLLNIKRVGERLEEWCNQEYQQHAINGFDNCTWEKDNLSVKDDDEAKGTKADYIFKVYSSKIMNESTLLTSVTCEMKSEDPSSINKKKNADHYGKLDKDRKKKNCEYALLISELEWELDNDAPIRKILDYEKMYMVRPQYFIVFLSIITALGKKYQDVINEQYLQKEQFKDSEEILREFEEMKNEILNKSLRYLENHANTIVSNANKIADLTKEILKSGEIILNTYIEQIKSRIENFNLTKINKKIEEIN